jgi:predicted type IV restriction endonuclease
MKMDLKSQIEEIRKKFDSFGSNEQMVRQGIILPILDALNWPWKIPWIVYPEYVIENLRVDYALFREENKPFMFIEAKNLGKITDDSKLQLFRYSVIKGVQIALLTDGKEWYFFLTAEEGNFDDRIFSKFDLIEDDLDYVCSILNKYLKYDTVILGDALDNARDDHKKLLMHKKTIEIIPLAWNKMIEEQNELLIGLLSGEVQKLCGIEPNTEDLIRFISEKIYNNSSEFRKEEINDSTIKYNYSKTSFIKYHRLTDDFTGTLPSHFNISGKTIYAKFWNAFFVEICNYLYDIDRNIFQDIINNQNDVFGRTQKIFSKNRSESGHTPKKIKNSWWVNTTFSSNDHRSNIIAMLKKYSININEVEIYLRK